MFHAQCVLAASRSFENTMSNPTRACLMSSSAVILVSDTHSSELWLLAVAYSRRERVEVHTSVDGRYVTILWCDIDVTHPRLAGARDYHEHDCYPWLGIS